MLSLLSKIGQSLLDLFTSVIFGIVLMALTAAYIAVGSGLPAVREAFEMSDLQFFNAWPLRVLMGLLIINLSVVTWRRIPLTPPRYGVWCVHLGIITLILGTAFYYRNKVEGLTRIPVGQSIGYFYNTEMRALYVRDSDGRLTAPWLVPSLPRFHSYANPGDRVFDRRDLHGFAPAYLSVDPQTFEPHFESLAAELGVKQVWFDITGYWPYAEIRTDYIEDPDSNLTGLAVHLDDAHGGATAPTTWLVGSDPSTRSQDLGGVELEHRIVSGPEEIAALKTAALQMHRIDATVKGFSKTLYVQVGSTYTLGDTGYSFTVENFNPAFPMSGTGQLVQALTLMIKAPAHDASPAQQFRRMVLGGKTIQTDFLLNAPGAGPMGKRQKAPLDKDLTLLYTLNDPFQLLPLQDREKHTLLTAAAPGIVDIAVGLTEPATVRDLPDSGDTITVAPADDDPTHAPFTLAIERKDHLLRNQHVVEVPSALRNRDSGQAGIFQVVRVKVSSGNWSTNVFVPFSQYAAEESWSDNATADGRTVARSEDIRLPGSNKTFQIRLGQEYDVLPAQLTLDRFDAVPYAGMGASGSSLMRDFCSTLTIEDNQTHEKSTDVAHMNHPVYFANGAWLFFQAQWDPDGQRWTILGVGNRPGVWVMIAGCVMIVSGVLYAFYAKPLIIRRMKRKALEQAAARRTMKRESPVEVAV
jgi:hypothetical protein